MADLEDGEVLSDNDEEIVSLTTTDPRTNSSIHGSADGILTAPSIPAQPFRSTRAPVEDSSDDFSSESDDSCSGWKSHRKKKRVQEMDTAESNPCQSDTTTRKVNNVWGAVLQEQTLSHTMVGLGVDKLDAALQMDRNVENYDFTLAKSDTRPHKVHFIDTTMDSHDPFDKLIELDKFGDSSKRGTKRRWSIKDRIQKKPVKNQSETSVPLSESEKKVLSEIVTELNEPNVELFGRMVHVLGEEKTLELLKMTRDKEAEGGILTFNGDRRRTSGGVYIYLLKNDADIEKNQIKEIFIDDYTKRQKEHRSRQRQKRRHRRQKSTDLSDEIKECIRQKTEELQQDVKTEGNSEMEEPENEDNKHMEHTNIEVNVKMEENNITTERNENNEIECQTSEAQPQLV